MEKVLISGGTGLIGKILGQYLTRQGYQVSVLSRRKSQNTGFSHYYWNLEKEEIASGAFRHTDHVINLAGANLFSKRWTTSYKKTILDSRIHSTRLLVRELQSNRNRVKTFISNSAVGYYGNPAHKRISESHTPGDDFLAQVCKAWEDEARQARNIPVRTLVFRTGIVLSREGGALPVMAFPVNWGAGAPLGSGKQIFPWIHITDLCRMFLFAMQHPELNGTFNAVAPRPVSNKAITQVIARKLNRPLWLPNVPVWVLKTFLGEFADSLSASINASSEKIEKEGFEFQYKQIEEAIEALYPEK